jgi:hypothetical protein
MTLLLLGVLAAGPTERDARLSAAIGRYETAQFAKARDALLHLVDEDGGLNPSDHAEALCYLAASYLALGDRGSAMAQLRLLARKHPEAHPSVAAFPRDVVALANEMRAEVARSPAPAPAVPRNTELKEVTQRGDEPPPPPSRASTAPHQVELSAPPRGEPPSRAFAFVPLGVGHFVRGATATGGAWLAGELLCFVLSATTVTLLEQLKVPDAPHAPFQYGQIRPEDVPRATALNTVSTLSFIGGLVAVFADIIFGNIVWPTEPT